MTLYIIAGLICLFSVVALFLEIRSGGQEALGSARFWFEVAAFVTTLIFFIVASNAQQKESAAKDSAAEKQASDLQIVRNSQKAQGETLELQLRTQLAGAKDQAEAQKKELELQNEQNEISRRLIEAQQGEIQLLNRLNLNHNLSGIELSFTPSRERWNRIALAYLGTKSPPQQGVSYIDAPMTAERDGDHWRLAFGPIDMKEGNKKLDRLSTAEAANKAFEDVINEASLGLRIEWGNGTNTTLEPWSQDYPSAIYVSHDRISLTLHPPLVSWNLNELKDNATVKFYGRDFPIELPPSFRIRSLDPAVAFNQTIQLDWKFRGKSRDYEQQMNRQSSGPHKLNIVFKFVGPFAIRPEPNVRK